ncbi:MAG: hypothetical protein SGBAC_011301 [Bacillariaceae sp.]
MQDNTIYIEKYDTALNDDHVNDYDLSGTVDEVSSDLLQEDGADSWLPKLLRRQPIASWLFNVIERAVDSIIRNQSKTTSKVFMILIAIVLLLAPLGILGFFDDPTDPDASYGEILYRSFLQLIDTVWSLCMSPLEAVIRLLTPASYSPLFADEDDDDAKEEDDETTKVPSARRQILRSLVSKTQQTMPPLVPIPGAAELRPTNPSLKQSQPPPELEPAFLNPEDYPPGWLVFHPELGVVAKEEADAHDRGKANPASEKGSNAGAKSEPDDQDARKIEEVSEEETKSVISE